MKKVGKYLVLTQDELNDKLSDHLDKFEKEIREEAEERVESRVETLTDTVKNQKKTIKQLNEDKEELKIQVDVLESDRDDVRTVLTKEMHLEDLSAVLQQKKEDLDAREAKLKDRASKLDTDEDKSYKTGYADGVADGVRKISEITQADRDNAMKIAMVSAASHTPVANIKEVNRELRLTAGNEDEEDSES